MRAADEGSNYLFKESKSPKSNCLKCPQFFHWPFIFDAAASLSSLPLLFHAASACLTLQAIVCKSHCRGPNSVEDVLVIDINSIRVSTCPNAHHHCTALVLWRTGVTNGWLVILIRLDSQPETTSTSDRRDVWRTIEIVLVWSTRSHSDSAACVVNPDDCWNWLDRVIVQNTSSKIGLDGDVENFQLLT